MLYVARRRPLPERIVATVEQYFFQPGGAYSIAICRIFLFVYLYVHVYGLTSGIIGESGDHYLSTVDLAAYYPKSLVYFFFPSAPPPGWIIDAVRRLAAAMTICAILGLATRVTMVASVLCCTFLAALQYSWEPLWSHPYNGGLLAGFGFMFGRAGDGLSLDSLIARYLLRRPIPTARRVYRWPVILGLFGTTAVYFGGFYAKVSTPGFTFDLAWVLSDNLRNSVALPWLIYGKPLPAIPELIVDHEWLWRLAAVGHLATQALPILALFSLDRPYWRLAEGAIYVAGIFLLKEVMGFWNPPWILLAAFFVDWDFFLAKLGLLRSPRGFAPISRRYRALAALYAASFMAANLVVIVTRYDDRGRSRLYPLSSMTFYSSVAATKPYGEHRHYPFVSAELEIGKGDQATKYFCYPRISSYGTLALSGPMAMKLEKEVGAMRAAVQDLETWPSKTATDCNGTEIDIGGLDAVDLYQSILDIPPCPSRITGFEIGFRALQARYERGRDRIIAAAAEVPRSPDISIGVASYGLDVGRYDILLAKDPWENYRIGPLLVPPGRWEGASFHIDLDYYRSLPTGTYPIVVRVTETTGARYDFFGGVLYRS